MKKVSGRHELKYHINYGDILQLRSKLLFIASPDQNAIDENGYRVKSLYFDNYSDKALIEKIDGVNEREKFRLRLYNDDQSFIRLEKKSKTNGICFKQSTKINEDECRQLLDGNLEVLKKNGDPLCMELYTKMHYQQLRAKTIVDYRREAFIYPMGNVRVTLDYDIRTSDYIHDFLKTDPIRVPISGVYILEVKYDHFLPEIIRGMVSLSNRKNAAFSKYAAARIR